MSRFKTIVRRTGLTALLTVGGMVSVALAADDLPAPKTGAAKYAFIINTAESPALKDWAREKLTPTLAEWYPKIVALLPSEGFTAPPQVTIVIKPMDGVAYTVGTNIFASADWLQKEINGEAVGALIHEAVHVVQQYGPHARNPGWLVEGCADYIRWFKFEPQTHGADLVWLRRHGKNFSPHYHDSYRVTANFLNWVTEKYDGEIVAQMNAAMRAGQYEEGLWKKFTGRTVAELGAEWKKTISDQL